MDFSAKSQPPVSVSVLSVSEIVRRARSLLETTLPLGWVAGEVSNCTRAASGHLYFTLKDDTSQVRCVMWRTRAQLLPFQLRDGMHIEVRAQLTIYEPRGEMQLSVESVRLAGQGRLYEIFLQLKSKLEQEGLFDAAVKRELPRVPKRIGLVTSPAAAALRDVLITLKNRAPGLEVIIYPTPVQGDVGDAIAAAIDTASRRAHEDGIEAMIVCRGGGSIEDLWAFNHEAVVRALRRCAIPTVCGVGHETDVTLADLAADLRAATPTAAAQAVSAGYLEQRTRLPLIDAALSRAASQVLNRAYQRLDIAAHRLVHPRNRLNASISKIANLQLRLEHAQQRRFNVARAALLALSNRLTRRRPEIARSVQHLTHIEKRLASCRMHRFRSYAAQLDALASHFAHLNPEAVLQRGYAIVRNEHGAILRSHQQVQNGDALAIQLSDGKLIARATK